MPVISEELKKQLLKASGQQCWNGLCEGPPHCLLPHPKLADRKESKYPLRSNTSIPNSDSEERNIELAKAESLQVFCLLCKKIFKNQNDLHEHQLADDDECNLLTPVTKSLQTSKLQPEDIAGDDFVTDANTPNDSERDSTSLTTSGRSVTRCSFRLKLFSENTSPVVSTPIELSSRLEEECSSTIEEWSSTVADPVDLSTEEVKEGDATSSTSQAEAVSESEESAPLLPDVLTPVVNETADIDDESVITTEEMSNNNDEETPTTAEATQNEGTNITAEPVMPTEETSDNNGEIPSTETATEMPTTVASPDTKMDNSTSTSDEVEDHNMRYLFQAVGDLLNRTKEISELSQQIPTLLTSINNLRTEIKGDVADISQRLLNVEEDVKKIKTSIFSKDGKNIVSSNKDRISNLEQQRKDMQNNIDIIKQDSLANLQSEKRIYDLEVQVKTLKAEVSNGDDTIAYNWDNPRIERLENKLSQLEKNIQQQQQQPQQQQQQPQQPKQLQPPPKKQPPKPPIPSKQPPKQHIPPNKQGQPNTSPAKRTPRTYKDVTVNSDTLLLTDSNGSWIDPKKVSDKGSVQRHNCYTLEDISTFVGEAKVEKHPSKILVQVGTNNLTEKQDSKKVLLHTGKIVGDLKRLFPEARIYVSALLPRNDNLHKLAMQFNDSLDQVCDVTLGMRVIHHWDIDKSDLYDRLHLHTGGFFKFICNIKRSMFGILPPKKRHRR